jgi:hypothetical protein
MDHNQSSARVTPLQFQHGQHGEEERHGERPSDQLAIDRRFRLAFHAMLIQSPGQLGVRHPGPLAKLSAKNQLTLPKRALAPLGADPAPIYFEVEVQDVRIILTPARSIRPKRRATSPNRASATRTSPCREPGTAPNSRRPV